MTRHQPGRRVRFSRIRTTASPRVLFTGRRPASSRVLARGESTLRILHEPANVKQRLHQLVRGGGTSSGIFETASGCSRRQSHSSSAVLRPVPARPA